MSVPIERPMQPKNPPGVARPKPSWNKPSANKPAPKPVKGNEGSVRPVKRPGPPATPATPVPKPVKIFADGAAYSAANSAYNSRNGALKGFVKDPNSPTGWSFLDPMGRKAASRPPLRNERVISPQQIQKLNPNFYKKPAPAGGQAQGSPSASAPWLQGFSGGGGWAATTDGGWWNGDTGQYWKTGSPVPGGAAQPQTGGDMNALYASLLKMFEGL